jgi:23S rRNA (cytidine1920-2'-O)/16S rRNA (cytidine1409-2'-O)-methyltransferase
VHREVLAGALEHARAAGLAPQGLVASPLLGPAGNREFFLLAAAPLPAAPLPAAATAPAVAASAPGPAVPVDWTERIRDLVPE